MPHVDDIQDLTPLGCSNSELDCKTSVSAQPAYFPDPRFIKLGDSRAVEALLIHEGMALSVHHDGRYRLVMSVTAPDTAVSLRLQLLVTLPIQPSPPTCTYRIQKDGTVEQSGSTPELQATLTLPPINIAGSVDAKSLFGETVQNNDLARLHQVALEGRSDALARLYQRLPSVGPCVLKVERKGAARFGNLPPR